MCVTAPGRVLAIDGDQATVECAGVPLRLSTRMVPDLAPGDDVLVGFGVVICRLERTEAQAMASDLRLVARRPASVEAAGRRSRSD